MQGTLKGTPGLKLVIEYFPFKLEKAGYPPDKFFGLLLPHGLALREIDEGRRTVEPTTPAEVPGRPTVTARGMTNLYLSRGE